MTPTTPANVGIEGSDDTGPDRGRRGLVRRITGPLRARGRLLRPDPLTVLSSLVALGVYLPHGFDGKLSRDLGLYAYGGQRLAEGVPPYVGIVNITGPLAYLVPGVGAVAARIVGADQILGMRVLFMLISIACIGLAYVLGRDLFRSRLAGLATAAALLCFQGFINYATYGPREKTLMVLFLLAVLLSIVHQRWFVTGVFISLGTLTWQPVFLPAIAGALAAVLLGVPAGRLRALGLVVVGGLVPTVVTVGAYAAIGRLQLFLDDFVLISARYIHQTSLMDLSGWGYGLMVKGYGGSVWVFFIGVVALLVLSIRGLVRREGRREAQTAALVGSGAALVVAIVWTINAFNSWPDAFPLLPLAALGIGGIVDLLAERLPTRAALAGTIAWVLVATGMSLAYSIGSRNEDLDHQRESVRTALGVLPPGSRILSVEAPQPLVIAHQRNLSRFQLFGSGLIDYLDDSWPGGGAGYAHWVAERRPALIAVGNDRLPRWWSPELARDYRRVGTSVGWAWYARRDLGADTLDALHSALKEQSWLVEG